MLLHVRHIKIGKVSLPLAFYGANIFESVLSVRSKISDIMWNLIGLHRDGQAHALDSRSDIREVLQFTTPFPFTIAVSALPFHDAEGYRDGITRSWVGK